jgi:hypothetical protein
MAFSEFLSNREGRDNRFAFGAKVTDTAMFLKEGKFF